MGAVAVPGTLCPAHLPASGSLPTLLALPGHLRCLHGSFSLFIPISHQRDLPLRVPQKPPLGQESEGRRWSREAQAGRWEEKKARKCGLPSRGCWSPKHSSQFSPEGWGTGSPRLLAHQTERPGHPPRTPEAVLALGEIKGSARSMGWAESMGTTVPAPMVPIHARTLRSLAF